MKKEKIDEKFRCAVCGKPLDPNNFYFNKEGLAVCAKHKDEEIQADIKKRKINIKIPLIEEDAIPKDDEPLDVKTAREELKKLVGRTHLEIEHYLPKIKKKTGFSIGSLRKELQLMTYGEKPDEPINSKPASENTDELTEEEKEKAMALLKNPKLLHTILEVLNANVVGEEKTKLLLYLICITAKMEKKINAQITGDSASGKTYVLTEVLKLFPEDMVERYSRVSGTALDHAQLDFTNKILFIGEGAGAEAAIETIKLITDNVSDGVRALITEKDENGRITATRKESKGTPVFITTTAKVIDDVEFTNRLINVPITLTEEQTKKIIDWQAEQVKTPWLFQRDKETISVIQNIPKLLKPKKVLVPFSKSMEGMFPLKNIRTRRDYQKLLWLVQASAFLFQYQRQSVKIENEEYLIAEPQDLYNAYLVGIAALKKTSMAMHETTMRIWDYIKEHYSELIHEVKVGKEEFAPQEMFCINDFIMHSKMGYSSKTLWQHFNSLVLNGILGIQKVGRTNFFWKIEDDNNLLRSGRITLPPNLLKEVTSYLRLYSPGKKNTKEKNQFVKKIQLYDPIKNISLLHIPQNDRTLERGQQQAGNIQTEQPNVPAELRGISNGLKNENKPKTSISPKNGDLVEKEIMM